MHCSEPATPFAHHHMLPPDTILSFSLIQAILVTLTLPDAERIFTMLPGAAHHAEITSVGPLDAPGITTTKAFLS